MTDALLITTAIFAITALVLAIKLRPSIDTDKWNRLEKLFFVAYVLSMVFGALTLISIGE